MLFYSIGAAIIGNIHRFIGIRHAQANSNNNEQTIPLKYVVTIIVVHVIWFCLFLYYNFYRKVL